jgi:hypothetical protein
MASICRYSLGPMPETPPGPKQGPQVPTPKDIATLIADERDCDVLFVNGGIYRSVDATISELTRKRRRRANVLLILVTEGGDADAGFRIARCLQEKYARFLFLASGYCKSAGTLVALGANEIVIADKGELGPLDVQMSKPDELMQVQSGLTATAALKALHESAYEAFEHFFLMTMGRAGDSISTRTATHIAVQMASALYAPIYGHVDAMHVGEAGRALAIAEEYGQRLIVKGLNAQATALERLANDYPSHGFVIDRREATSLFKNVREPDELEQMLIDLLAEHAIEPRSGTIPPLVAYLSRERPESKDSSIGGPSNTAGAGDAPDASPQASAATEGESGPGGNAEDGAVTAVPVVDKAGDGTTASNAGDSHEATAKPASPAT